MHAERALFFPTVIATFACRATHQLWLGQRPAKVPPSLQQVALRKLTQLQAATSLNDLRIPPGNRLQPLKGNRQGQRSIRINDQYRLCFHWEGREAYEIEITDYH
jgi:proteic killer suppression protein